VKHIIRGIPPDPGPQVKSVTVEEDGAGQRLDNYLMKQLKGVPKTHVYRIIRSGEVRVNKGRAGAETRLELGDVVRVPPVRVSERAAGKAQAMAAASDGSGVAGGFAPAKDFPVLFEDDHFMAINKPAGVAVHGGSGVSFGVIEQLRMARPQAKFLELVHRLDRETSGILLIAKKRSALNILQNQFRERETGKVYLALALGRWPANKKVLDKSLHKYLLPGKHGEEGEVTIKTGRTHQIRVHLASEGMPIAGDDKYGDFEANKALLRAEGAGSLKRMFLHAWRFQCKHPSTGKRIEIQADLPPELMQFLLYAMPEQPVAPLAAGVKPTSP